MKITMSRMIPLIQIDIGLDKNLIFEQNLFGKKPQLQNAKSNEKSIFIHDLATIEAGQAQTAMLSFLGSFFHSQVPLWTFQRQRQTALPRTRKFIISVRSLPGISLLL